MTEEDDPFADLEDTVSGDTTDESPDTTATTTTTQRDTPTMSTQETQPDTDPLKQKAFEFSEASQTAVYARDDTLDAFDTKMTEIELAAKKLGAKEVSKTEIHDAILRTVDPEEVAEAVVEERRDE